jgi:hypothetical protein
MVDEDAVRMASCVTGEASYLLKQDRRSWQSLTGRSDNLGSLVRVASIRSLAQGLAFADDQLARINTRDVRRAQKGLGRVTVGLEADGRYMDRERR